MLLHSVSLSHNEREIACSVSVEVKKEGHNMSVEQLVSMAIRLLQKQWNDRPSNREIQTLLYSFGYSVSLDEISHITDRG